MKPRKDNLNFLSIPILSLPNFKENYKAKLGGIYLEHQYFPPNKEKKCPTLQPKRYANKKIYIAYKNTFTFSMKNENFFEPSKEREQNVIGIYYDPMNIKKLY